MCLTWKNKINIIILNTALISDDNREHGEIIDIDALSKITTNKELPTLVLGHHDFYSICTSQRERMKRIFENLYVKAYLCGDTHKSEIKFIDKYDDVFGKIPCIICGKSVVQAMDSYSDVGVIDYSWNEDGYTYVTPYRWGEKMFDEGVYIDTNYRVDLSRCIIICTSNFMSEKDVIKSMGMPIFSRFDDSIMFEYLSISEKEIILDKIYNSYLQNFSEEEKEIIRNSNIHQWHKDNLHRFKNVRIIKSRVEKAINDMLVGKYIFDCGKNT